MKEKIKNLLAFVGRAWRAGPRGKIGIALAIFAMFIIIRMFVGNASIPGIIMNSIHLRNETAVLSLEKQKLGDAQMHIQLIQQRSPDYISELAQKYLNIGDPRLKILK
ncbi:MAG: hypothetical protein LBR41_00275 [Rickettsiales bacterium]|nr:hypothetical protein [Rickettsiales bacterium]